MPKPVVRSYYLMIVLALLFASSSALAAQGLRGAKAHASHHATHRRKQKHPVHHATVPHADASAVPVLLGDEAVEPRTMTLIGGQAEAFRLRAGSTGTADLARVYTSTGSTAADVVVGIYSNGPRRPGSLLSSGAAQTSLPGGWTTVPIKATNLVEGETYWLAILPANGTLRYRDSADSSCMAITSARTNRRTLPSFWPTRPHATGCFDSMYLTNAAALEGELHEESGLELPPQAVAPPAISGTTLVGHVLNASPGQWKHNPTAYGYHWQDCSPEGEGCSTIGGAGSSSYKLGMSDVGHKVRVVVTASNADGTAEANSPDTEAVNTEVLVQAPVSTAAPSITGTPEEGQTLSASEGSWLGSPKSIAYRWEDCNEAGEACTPITGATSVNYTLAASDVGHTIRVTLTASNTAGAGEASSEATDTVLPQAPVAPVNAGRPAVSGVAEEGQTLNATEGSWSHSPTSFGYQWEDCDSAGESCASISGATSSSYTLAASDVSHKLRVVVTATNAGGSAEASSEASSTVVPQPPANTGPPVVNGTDEEGKTLTSTEGSWSRNPTSFAYQWEDCNGSGEACVSISGATSSTYKLASGDVGHKLRVVVTATNGGGSAKASSEATRAVVPLAPENTALPNVSGTTEEGKTLSASEGSWSHGPTSFTYQWEDCNSSGEACVSIGGGTSSSYKLAASDVGHKLRVVVTATNAGGSAEASSEASSTVVPQPPANTGLPVLSGTTEEGQTLSASEGSWSRTPTSFGYQWEDCNSAGESCVSISGATSSTYKLASGDVGHKLRVVVTATNGGGSAKASSEATGAVLPQPPANTGLPKVSGTTEEGQTLSASEGSWSHSPTSFGYQWEDCDSAGENCANVSGATSSTHKLASGDVGHTLRVVVTAANGGGFAKASSEATAVVTTIKAPANTALPKVSGSDEEGKTLTTTEGSWSGSPTSFGYQWEDCNTSGEGCATISGAVSSSYKLTSGDVGHKLRVVVTATNAGGSTEASSEATATVGTAGSAGVQIYVSQPGAGNDSGEGSCSNAHTLSWLKQEGSWGSSSGKVGPGATVELCGTFTEPVEVRGSGTASKPITLRFMQNAKIAMGGSGCPGNGCLYVAGGSEYVTIDGGVNGVIENTERGTKKEKTETGTTGIVANGCKHCAIENLEIANLYVAEKGDTVGNTEIRGIKIRPEGSTPEYITIKNDVFHDMGWAVNIEAAENTSHINIEHNTFYHLTHGFTPGASFSGGNVGPIVFAHNHFYGNINWEDGETDTNHVDGIHCFAGNEKEPHYSGLYIYDNYITTEGHNVTGPIFMEGSNGHTPCADKTSKIWIFDNVLTGTSCCGLAGDFAGEPHIFDNTLIGNSKSEEACEVFNSDASVKLVVQNVRFKNNVVTTCRTLLDAEKQLIASGGMGYNLLANAGGGGESLACRSSGAKYFSMNEYSSWRSCMEDGEEHTIVTGEAKVDLKEEVGELGRPQSGSEAIGNGANLTNLCPETPEEALCQNIEGEARPNSGAWNIGAY